MSPCPDVLSICIIVNHALQVSEAIQERAKRIYDKYGNVMLDVKGMTKAGVERKATCRALFSKLLYLAGQFLTAGLMHSPYCISSTCLCFTNSSYIVILHSHSIRSIYMLVTQDQVPNVST